MRKSALLLSLLLGACSLAPGFAAPDMAVPDSYKEEAARDPGKWAQAAPMETADRGQWWSVFNDAKLAELQDRAVKANNSLQAAAARVEQARLTAAVKKADVFPELDLGANASRVQQSGIPFSGALKPYNLYDVQSTVSYEPDLFNRIRDEENALWKDTKAQEANFRSLLLTLQADVAQTYYALRSLDAERHLLRDTVKTREEAARIMQNRFDEGEVGAQDQARAQGDLAGVRAELLALDRTRATYENALAVLLGLMPSEFTFAEDPLSGLPPQIPSGIPSTLLTRRPDIAQALALMEAANARIGSARAAFFPSLFLTATGGVQSGDIDDLFQWSARTWALGQMGAMALTVGIFSNNRATANLDRAWAGYDESLANYRQSVLTAFQDVEDNLAAQRLLARQSEHQDAAAAAATRTHDLTRIRYDEGDADYFEVVDAQRTSLSAERAAVQVRGQRFLTTVSLIRALGGGWSTTIDGATTPENLLAPPLTPGESHRPPDTTPDRPSHDETDSPS